MKPTDPQKPRKLTTRLIRHAFVTALGLIFVLVLAAVFLFLNTRVERRETMKGVQETYTFFGSKLAERYYRNGLLEGPATFYYRDGKVKSEWNYRAGLKEGVSRRYDERGNLLREEEYAADKPVLRRDYDTRGTLLKETRLGPEKKK